MWFFTHYIITGWWKQQERRKKSTEYIYMTEKKRRKNDIHTQANGFSIGFVYSFRARSLSLSFYSALFLLLSISSRAQESCSLVTLSICIGWYSAFTYIAIAVHMFSSLCECMGECGFAIPSIPSIIRIVVVLHLPLVYVMVSRSHCKRSVIMVWLELTTTTKIGVRIRLQQQQGVEVELKFRRNMLKLS